jgi:hypothetical protein
LSERDAKWRYDPLVAPFIERLLRALDVALSTGPPTAVGRWAREKDRSGWLRHLPDVGRPESDASIATPLGSPTSADGPATIADAAEREGSTVVSGCAGVWLLARAVIDARLPGVLAAAAYPSSSLTPAERLRAVLLAIALRLSGAGGIENGVIDPGLRLMAGQALSDTPPTFAKLRDLWASGDGDEAKDPGPQLDLLRILIGQRLVGGPFLHLHLMKLGTGVRALVAGDESAAVWPLGCVIRSPRDIGEAVDRWSSVWSEMTGHMPVLLGDGSLTELEGHARSGWITRPRAGTEEATRHRASRERLRAAMAALDENQLDRRSDDLAMSLIAITLLRVWARWLRQFSDSTVPYLLEHFIRRPGWITVRPDATVIELAPRPLDIVVQMSGYAAEVEGVSWLGGRHLQFDIPV